MAEIRVSNDRFGRSLPDALALSKSGDVLVLHEGDYTVEGTSLNSLRIVGIGDQSKIIIRGNFEIRGHIQISNLTICAPHFHNAINVKTPGARVEIDGCTIHGDPTSKYPAVYCSEGTVVMRRSNVHFDKASTGVYVETNGELQAFDSGVAGLKVNGAKAVLNNASAFYVWSLNRGRVEASGYLNLFPDEKKLSLAVESESVCKVEWMRVTASTSEGRCDESLLQLGRVEVPEGQKFLVTKKGRALVETSSPMVVVKDPDAVSEPAPAPPPPVATAPDPKFVLWRPEDARSFSAAVAPHLNKGDTVLMEEGEYYLEEYDHVLQIGVDICGKGRADRTFINGTLVVMEGCDIAVSNLTLRPTAARNALMMQQGNSVSMTNVIFECPADAEVPAIYISQGTASMSGCNVVVSPESEAGGVDIDGGAHLDATDSHLGWLAVVGGGSADLSACSSLRIWARNSSRVTSVGGHHIEANTCSMRQLVAEDDAVVRFDQITTDAPDFDAYVAASTLAIEWLETTEGGHGFIFFKDNAQVSVEGGLITFTDLDAPEPEPDAGLEESAESVDPVAVPAVSSTAGEPAATTPEPAEMPGKDNFVKGHDTGDALAEILSLTGLSTVKDQVQAFTRMVQFNQLREKQGLKNNGLNMHSMFLGNPGTGKTTVARLLGRALFHAGAIKRDVFIEVGRRDLVGEHLGASANMTRKVLDSALGGVLFIDEAYSLYQRNNNEFGQEAVDTLLAFMENNRDDIVIIFAGYTDRMQDFLSMNPGLESRVPNRFDFEDYSPGDIAEIGYLNLLHDDYTVDEALYRRLVAGKYGRSADKSNGRWVRNFNQDLIKEMARRVLGGHPLNPADLAHIADEDVYQLVGGDSEHKGENIEALLEQLDRLVGLASVKEWVRKLVNRVKVDQQRMELGGCMSRPTYHMVFTGNPGTGKTTVARIIGQLFYNLGILDKPQVKVVERSSLVGSFIGHTEANTTRAIDEAMGGVLFVDEAYQLSVEHSPNDFGKQAIETFMTRLENDRDKFVAIFAGYTENMDQFLNANPGLRSRIPLTIEFPDFEPEEVGKIVVSHLAGDWTFDESTVASAAAKAYSVLGQTDRSNGRWARNFAERLESEQIEYVAANGITGADMERIPLEVIQSLSLA